MGLKNITPFGKRLDSLRIEGEKKEDFAVRLGVPRSNLSKYFYHRTPDPDILERISRATGVNIGWLLTGQGSKWTSDHIINDVIEGVYGPLDAEEAAFEAQNREQNGSIGRPYASDDAEVRVLGAKVTKKLSPEAIARIIISYLSELPLDRFQRELASDLVVDLFTDPSLRELLLDYYSYHRDRKKT